MRTSLTTAASAITSAFRELYLENEGNHFRVDEKVDMSDLMSTWLDNLEVNDFRIDKNLEVNDFRIDKSLEVDDSGGHGGFDQENLPKTEDAKEDPYRGFILNSASYKWLVTSLRQELLLEAPCHSSGNAQSQISKEISSQLKPRRISRMRAPALCGVVFHAVWDPLAFCKEQGYPGRLEEAIENALTLTGGDDNIELLTCSEYVCRTWPSIGGQVLHWIKSIIRVRSLSDEEPEKSGEIQHRLRG